jgi:coenzyme F420 biosynthesis associated uncharacterized protein
MDDMSLAADRLVDWKTAATVGRTVAGSGSALTALDRARLFEDFGELVPETERLIQDFTGLAPGTYRSRAWVMTRDEWLRANLRGFERVLEPFARKLLSGKSNRTLAQVRRSVLGAQVGAFLGYLGHRVLGQYDIFLPPDDDGVLYFVGANVAGVERKFRFDPRQFRTWICLHEVTHRLQFGGASWLRGHLTSLMDTYLGSVEVDPGWLAARLKTAIEEVRRGTPDHRGLGWVFLLMTPDQREVVQRMQAVMSLLEGHGNFVMNELSPGRVPSAPRFRQVLHERRHRAGLDRAFQKAIGFDVKVRQYDLGERFVTDVVGQAGMEGFNRVWDGPEALPSLEEIARPADWVARVAAS